MIINWGDAGQNCSMQSQILTGATRLASTCSRVGGWISLFSWILIPYANLNLYLRAKVLADLLQHDLHDPTHKDYIVQVLAVGETAYLGRQLLKLLADDDVLHDHLLELLLNEAVLLLILHVLVLLQQEVQAVGHEE